jgi:hypothetical protein
MLDDLEEIVLSYYKWIKVSDQTITKMPFEMNRMSYSGFKAIVE